MLTADFDYHLPKELIAQHPLPDRAASRMLHLRRGSGRLADRAFRDLPSLLRPDDLLVFNNTRVFPARLFGHRAGLRAQPVSARNPAARQFLRGKVEVFLTRQLPGQSSGLVWEALVHPGRKINVGEQLSFHARDAAILTAEVIARGDFGQRTLRFAPVPDFFAALEAIGHVPLPPYIARPDFPADRERYQTIFADPSQSGAVAAPTAGLHFTPEVLHQLHARGIETTPITLHVGLGTFQPIHVSRVEDHRMHSENFNISASSAAKINAALASRRRIVALGTTTVRTLEYCAAQTVAPGTPVIPSGDGAAGIFIYPGFEFRVVGALLTNFHLPQSTLLMLLCAFAGRGPVLAAYRHAVEQKYRFYSYGDCMFVE